MLLGLMLGCRRRTRRSQEIAGSRLGTKSLESQFVNCSSKRWKKRYISNILKEQHDTGETSRFHTSHSLNWHLHCYLTGKLQQRRSLSVECVLVKFGGCALRSRKNQMIECTHKNYNTHGALLLISTTFLEVLCQYLYRFLRYYFSICTVSWSLIAVFLPFLEVLHYIIAVLTTFLQALLPLVGRLHQSCMYRL
jgi:hypothetical protein